MYGSVFVRVVTPGEWEEGGLVVWFCYAHKAPDAGFLCDTWSRSVLAFVRRAHLTCILLAAKPHQLRENNRDSHQCTIFIWLALEEYLPKPHTIRTRRQDAWKIMLTKHMANEIVVDVVNKMHHFFLAWFAIFNCAGHANEAVGVDLNLKKNLNKITEIMKGGSWGYGVVTSK